MLNNLKRLEICKGSTQRIRSTIISLSGASCMEHLGVYVNLSKSRRRSIQATKRDRESSGRALFRLMDSCTYKGPMKVETAIGKYAKRWRSLTEYGRYVQSFFYCRFERFGPQRCLVEMVCICNSAELWEP